AVTHWGPGSPAVRRFPDAAARRAHVHRRRRRRMNGDRVDAPNRAQTALVDARRSDRDPHARCECHAKLFACSNPLSRTKAPRAASSLRSLQQGGSVADDVALRCPASPQGTHPPMRSRRGLGKQTSQPRLTYFLGTSTQRRVVENGAVPSTHWGDLLQRFDGLLDIAASMTYGGSNRVC